MIYAHSSSSSLVCDISFLYVNTATRRASLSSHLCSTFTAEPVSLYIHFPSIFPSPSNPILLHPLSSIHANMFSRSFIASAVALLAAVSQVQAHAYISPGLGVSGTGVRNDVQRPSTGSPCGSANLAAIDSSTAAVATNGLFNAVRIMTSAYCFRACIHHLFL